MTFTIEQLLQLFLVFCGAIITIGGAGKIIYSLINKLREPGKGRATRIVNIEERLEKHDEYLDRDKKEIQEMKEGLNVIMHSMLALMSHELDGNHTKDLEKARNDLQEYLIRR